MAFSYRALEFTNYLSTGQNGMWSTTEFSDVNGYFVCRVVCVLGNLFTIQAITRHDNTNPDVLATAYRWVQGNTGTACDGSTKTNTCTPFSMQFGTAAAGWDATMCCTLG